VGVYLALSSIAILIIVLFVPNLNARDDPRRKGESTKDGKAKFSLKLCAKTLQQLTNKLQLCMVPLNFYIGMEEGFMMVEFTMVSVERHPKLNNVSELSSRHLSRVRWVSP
jgi:hypothetical protein